jgi:transposase
LKTDFGGLPIAFHLTGGEASDSRNFEALLDIGPDINPRAALGDKGYDSKSNREAARQRGICPAIPYQTNTKDIPAFFPKVLYKGRARIEQAVGKLKRFKRIALRCEKTAQNYGSFVVLACAFILIKSVHTAYSHAQIASKTDFSPEHIYAICYLFDHGEERLLAAVERGPCERYRCSESISRRL